MYKNMKIAITDEAHLKAVCEVLESMGYKLEFSSSIINYIFTYIDGSYSIYRCDDPTGIIDYYHAKLDDLLRMRDEMVKENARH